MIPLALYEQPAMLAQQSKTIAPLVDEALRTLVSQDSHGGWFFDLKYDGIRCMAYVDQGHVVLMNRNDVDITHRYPEIVAGLLSVYPDYTIVLDGEIVVLKDGLPNFAGAHRRDAQSDPAKALALSKVLPATLMVFDLLYHQGDDLRALPFTSRRALLKAQEKRLAKSGTVAWARSEREGAAMWEFVAANRMEGLIAKRGNSPYVAGRSFHWVKLKPVQSVSCLVSGFDAGKGARASTFGNLHLCLLNERSELVSVGKVGSGFNERDLREILPLLTNPGPDPLIVEVEYQEVSAAGQLRFPVFKGIRTDVLLTGCTTDQLTQPQIEEAT